MANRLTPAKLDAFYAAVGHFIVAWADMEVCLDLLVLAIRNRDSKLPHQLAAKTKIVRRQASKLSTDQTQEAGRLMDEIDALSETRHDYAHGGIVGHTFIHSRLIVTLDRILQPEKKPRRAAAKVTALQLEAATSKVIKIGDHLLDLAESILKERKLGHN